LTTKHFVARTKNLTATTTQFCCPDQEVSLRECTVKTNPCFRYTCFRYEREIRGERDLVVFYDKPYEKPYQRGLVESSPFI